MRKAGKFGVSQTLPKVLGSNHQNGFVNEPNIAAASQETFPPASNQAQYSGNSNQIQGSDTQFGAGQFAGHQQEVYGGQYGQQLQDQSAQQQGM